MLDVGQGEVGEHDCEMGLDFAPKRKETDAPPRYAPKLIKPQRQHGKALNGEGTVTGLSRALCARYCDGLF